VVPALGLWCGSAVALWWQAHIWMPLVALSGVGVLMWWRARRQLYVFVVLLVVGIGSSGLRIVALTDVGQVEIQQTDFVVTTDPVARVTTGSMSFQKSYSLHADVVRRSDLSIRIPIVLTFSAGQLSSALPTSTWRCMMSLQSTYVIHHYSAFGRCHSPPEQVSGPSRYQVIASFFREGLANATYRAHSSSDAAALLPALVDGDVRGQTQHLTQALQQSGLGHVTAVSGANVAILFTALNFVLLRLRLSARLRLVVQVLALVAFVVVARPTPSVVRAAVMAGIALTYWWLGWRRYAEVVVLLAVIGLLALDPWLSVSWGFALSAAATLGLILLPSLWGMNSENRIQQLLVTALAATLATVPLLIAMGTHPTFASIPANVLAEVFIAPATIVGFLCLVTAALTGVPVLGAFFGIVTTLLVWCGIVCCTVIIWIAEFLNQTPFSTSVVSFSGVLAIIVAVTAAFRLRNLPSQKLLMVSLGLLSLVLALTTRIESWVAAWPLSDWNLVACDVGQGDASVIRTSVDSAIVIDAGGDDVLIDSCLSTLGISKIDLFIVSHFHADHVGGITGLVRGREVVRALVPPQQSPLQGYKNVTAEIESLQIARVGDSGEIAGVRWQVLYVGTPIGTSDDGSVINNASVVVLITMNHHTILFTGDIEVEGQSALMSSLGNLHVDVVKIAHHGSRYQDPRFAAWTHPSIAWASVGADNPYGHPAIDTLNAYRALGAVVVTTKDCGSLAFRITSAIEWRGSKPCHA
jgi:competence protein ComEC